MAFYADWNRPAPQPSQFGTIDLSEIDLDLVQGMSDDAFKKYAYKIDAFDSGSDLAKATGNPTDLNISSSKFDENVPSGFAVATISGSDPNAGCSHLFIGRRQW